MNGKVKAACLRWLRLIPRRPPGNWIKPKGRSQADGGWIFASWASTSSSAFGPKRSWTLARRTDHGKILVRSAGWQPICEKRFPFELTASFTLNPLTPGVVDMALPHKIQDQHRLGFSARPAHQRRGWAATRPMGARETL